MNSTKLFLITAFCFGLLSCSQDEPECSMIVDSVFTIDQKLYQGIEYYLVLRWYGWHDKVEVIELYDQKPVFDRCNNAINTPIIADSMDTGYTKSFAIDLKNKEFIIEYTDSPTNKDAKAFYRLNFKE